MYHQIFTSVKIASPMPARAGNFARTFRRTFRRRLWQQGPTRNGGGSSSPWETHSGLCRFSGTGFRKNHFFDYRRNTNAGRRPPLAVSCRGRHRLWDAGDCVSISRRKKNFSSNRPRRPARGSAARPRPRPGDACRSIAPKTDVSQIGRNRIAVAGTPWNLRTDVPTDVPTPVMEEKKIILEPTSTTGRGSAARPRPRPGDACRSIARRPTFLKSVEIASPLSARHRNFARTFRRTFRRRLWRQGPTRYGGGCSYGISQKSGKLRE